MTLREACRLAGRELLARRTQSVAAVVVMGVTVGLILAILMVMQGLENVALRYAWEGTDGSVYLVNYYDNDKMLELILKRINKYEGRIVTLTPEQLGDDVNTGKNIVVKFEDLREAYDFWKKSDTNELHYRSEDYEIVELFGNQVAVYGYFRRMDRNLIWPVVLILSVVAAVIAVLMMSHILVRSMETFVLYRTLGASKGQVLMISGIYLLELCGMAMMLAVLIAIVMVGMATVVGWQYISEKLVEAYLGSRGFAPILVGWNWRNWVIIAAMVLLIPLTLGLSLDQFSTKRMAWRLKGE